MIPRKAWRPMPRRGDVVTIATDTLDTGRSTGIRRGERVRVEAINRPASMWTGRTLIAVSASGARRANVYLWEVR